MQNNSNVLETGSAREIGESIAAGRITSLEATQWYLERIERFNSGGSGFNCVRSISPMAIGSAKRADAEMAAGISRGPLHGVPYLVKDNIFTADGSYCSAGSRALQQFLPPYEASVVSRLNEAGAVLLGKTNLTEFADFVADTMPSEFSGVGGVVKNPLGTEYGRGQGSSVGSAGAVAARFCAFALGTETQNSIQAPAVYSSVVGFKPSVGRVSRYGIFPLVPSQDSPGTLTINVDDAELIFNILSGVDMHDPATLFAMRRDTQGPISLKGLRIGIPRRFVSDNVMTDERKSAFEDTLDALKDAGAIIVDPCDLPSAKQLHDVRSCVFRSEFKDSLNVLLAELRPCGMTSMEDIIQWNREHPDAIPFGQSLLEAASKSSGTLSEAYRRDRKNDVFLSDEAGIRAALTTSGSQILLAPMSAAAKCTGKAGSPVAAVPVGMDDAGLPFGVTIFSAPGDDEIVLRAAVLIEKAVGRRILPNLNS